MCLGVRFHLDRILRYCKNIYLCNTYLLTWVSLIPIYDNGKHEANN